ncbi:MAG TPA: hypothetical protein VJ656_14105 [Pyrinomonadaceae bacterium]|nr:hypothetical protein [Pyrinomonadaceae bacterium]
MPRVAAILGFSVALVLFCGFSPGVYAQQPELDAPPGARKFDEFGRVGHCDVTARLDNLAVSIHESPSDEAHIIYYGSPGTDERVLGFMKDYLVMARGLPANRIKTAYGGRNSDLKLPKTELWIVPRNAQPPELKQHETNVETFKGLLDDDDSVFDSIAIEIEDEMGPGVGRTTRAAFADILNQQKNVVGYVVVYSGEDAIPGASRTIAQDELDYLKQFNVELARVKTIFGGHRKETRRQLWILPKDEPPPVRDAGPELPPAKTVSVGHFWATDLSLARNETNVFKRLKDILTGHKSVRAFVVVRLEVPSSEESSDAEEPEAARVPEESSSEPIEERQPADLTKLVEKWRVELANTHKISADRFIVLFTTAPAYDLSHLRIWIVPKRQPLPDPNEEDEPEVDPVNPV